MGIFWSTLFDLFIIHGKKELVKYSVLEGKVVNELGFLDEWFIEGIIICKLNIIISSNACDTLVLIASRDFHETSLLDKFIFKGWSYMISP